MIARDDARPRGNVAMHRDVARGTGKLAVLPIGARRRGKFTMLPVAALTALCGCVTVHVHREAPKTTVTVPPTAGSYGEFVTAVVPDVSTYGKPSAEVLLDGGATVAGEKIVYPRSGDARILSQIVTIAPGQRTGWHRHAVPTYGRILSGTLEVEYAGVGRRTLAQGDTLLEAMNTAHNGVNLGTEPVRILVVYMGSKGEPTVLQADPPPMPKGLGGKRASDLVELAEVDPELKIDLRYATDDNFTGRVVYGVARALMQRPAAEALRRANGRARAAGYRLAVLDAYRPWSVTRRFWDDFPMHRGYLADPLEGSRHNRGCAVDVTLVDLATGAEVPMPSAYDDFSERAHPNYTGGQAARREARDRLRSFLEAEGFHVYKNEWWHFDYDGWEEWPVLDLPLDHE